MIPGRLCAVPDPDTALVPFTDGSTLSVRRKTTLECTTLSTDKEKGSSHDTKYSQRKRVGSK